MVIPEAFVRDVENRRRIRTLPVNAGPAWAMAPSNPTPSKLLKNGAPNSGRAAATSLPRRWKTLASASPPARKAPSTLLRLQERQNRRQISRWPARLLEIPVAATLGKNYFRQQCALETYPLFIHDRTVAWLRRSKIARLVALSFGR